MALFVMEKSNTLNKLLSDKYIVPPFSILNTISSAWQRRKDMWESLGIDSAEGRDVKRNNAMPVNTFSARGEQVKTPERTSTFDPVLCEVMYEWFSNEKSVILDPFAGGSVRGIVANALGRDYFGIDLSTLQVEENRRQLAEYASKYKLNGTTEWVVGDSVDIFTIGENRKFDMLFTCPPYYNLEKYSTDKRDLSNQATYDDFITLYELILNRTYPLLNENSFAVIVVSEIRNPKTGAYYGFVPDTIRIMTTAGYFYYDEMILENNIGSLPIRAPKYFEQSRKIGRHHQNILVFYKGDTTKIEENFGRFTVKS